MAGRRALFQRLAFAVLVTAGTLPSLAQSRRQPPPPPPSKGPIDYLEGLMPWTNVGPAPDFVRESRPAESGEFVPVGTDPGEQSLSVKSPAELAAAKAELEQAKALHEDVKAHPPALTAAVAPPPPPPPAAEAKPAVTKATSKHRAKRKPRPSVPPAE